MSGAAAAAAMEAGHALEMAVASVPETGLPAPAENLAVQNTVNGAYGASGEEREKEGLLQATGQGGPLSPLQPKANQEPRRCQGRLFCMQVIVTFILIILCCIKIFEGKSSEITAVYLPLLTGVVGYWFPGPGAPALEPPEDEPKGMAASVARAMTEPSHRTFWAQVAISLTLIGVMCAKIFEGGDPAIYLPVLTAVTMYWLPAPNQKS